jgi:hypothetical protein
MLPSRLPPNTGELSYGCTPARRRSAAPPNAFSRSIAATWSGVCITSLRGNFPREAGCTKTVITLLLGEGVQFSMSIKPQFICRLTASLLAMILYAKFGQHQPLNRQSDVYAREGIELDVSTLADWVGACSATLARSSS